MSLSEIKVNGITGALIVIFIFFSYSFYLYKYFDIYIISYFWLCFTALTGIWEFTYVTNRKSIIKKSNYLLATKTHVWFSKYNISMILPWNTSYIFYAEYGAYADKEYMTNKDKWSILIEGSHCLFCGLFAFLSLYFNYVKYYKNFYLCIAISMGTQLMNSILYMGEYFIQIKTPSSINYNTPTFPCGKYLLNRPFMYINIFWTIMPLYILIHSLNFLEYNYLK
jgi:hypothetical protein